MYPYAYCLFGKLCYHKCHIDDCWWKGKNIHDFVNGLWLCCEAYHPNEFRKWDNIGSLFSEFLTYDLPLVYSINLLWSHSEPHHLTESITVRINQERWQESAMFCSLSSLELNIAFISLSFFLHGKLGLESDLSWSRQRRNFSSLCLMRCNAMQCNVMWCIVMQCNSLQCNSVQCNYDVLIGKFNNI